MITLGTSLEDLLNGGAQPFWLLKLYYNDESAFIGVSDQDRTVSGTQYHGAARFGTLAQSADLFTFSVSGARMQLTIDNTLKAFSGQRFSDLYASKNFDNRKWELYLAAETTLSTDTIGTGRISADNSGNDVDIRLDLADMTSRFDTQIPTTTQASGTNVPPPSVGAPIPMAYGDFDRTNTDTASGLSSANPKGRFPALITDSRDIDAAPDSVALHTLQTENVYVPQSDGWGKIDAVSATAATPIITFTGTRNDVYVKFLSVDTADGVGSDLGNIIDEDPATTGTLASKAAGALATYNFYLDPIDVQGTITSTNFYLDIDSVNAEVGSNGMLIAGDYFNAGTSSSALSGNQTDNTDISNSVAGTAGTTPPDEASYVTVTIAKRDGVDIVSLDAFSLVCYIQMESHGSFTRNVTVKQLDFPVIRNAAGRSGKQVRPYTTQETFDVKYVDAVFDQGQYVFYSGKGRKYGAWVDADSRNNGFDSGDLISNPIYIVEDMLRTELGMATADIRIAAFDEAGNTTDGDIESTFGLDAASVLFAFSQYKFADPPAFAQKIGSQSGTLYFVGGDGKFTCKARRRSAGYTSGDTDFKLNYNDLSNISVTRTPVNQVRNNVVTSYGFNYSTEQMETIDTASSDSTSQGSTVNGYKQVLNLEMDLDLTLDQPTSAGYSNALLDFFSIRRVVLEFDTHLATAQKLEVGDIIRIVDWPDDFYIYGLDISDGSHFYMVTSTAKKGPGTTRLRMQQVS